MMSLFRVYKRSLLLLALTVSVEVRAASDTLTVFARTDATAGYVESVLRLAFRKSGNLVDLRVHNHRVNAPEWRDALEAGHVDVMWSVSTPELEQRFKRIPVDLYFGYMGLRVCVSNAHQAESLKNIKSSNDLKQLTFGSGVGWSDTQKLINAQMNVVQDDLDRLVDKAREGSINCFARGIFEPWDERIKYLQRGITDLVINSNFAIRYDNPFYLYVNKSDKINYERLMLGLSKALEDGSLESTFKASKQYKQFEKYAHIEHRVVIDLP